MGLDGTPLEMEDTAQKEKAFNEILVNVKAGALEYYSTRLASGDNVIY